MVSFRVNSFSRRIAGILVCVLLSLALWIPSGCRLSLPKADPAGSSDTTREERDAPEATDETDQTDKTNQTEGKKDKKSPSDKEKKAVYTMDLTLDIEAHTIGGLVTVDVYNYSDDDWNSLCFRDYPSLFTPDSAYGVPANGKLSDISDLRDMTNQKNLEFARSAEDVSVVSVALKDPIRPGETRRIAFSFSACVPQLGDRYGYTGDTYNLSNFYPVLAVYEDGAWVAHPYFVNGECFYSLVSDYFVTFHTPSDMTVACSGEETEREDGDWTVEARNVRDISAVIAKGFQTVSENVDGVMVNCYYTQNKAWAEIAVDAGVTAIQTFTEAFGPYPYPELDIMQTDLFAGGMEYPSIILIYKDFEADPDPDAALSTVVAHETAHQWFYSLVGDDQFDEAWLDESFASFAECVYMETYMDRDDVAKRIDAMQSSMGGDDFTDMGDSLRLNRPYDDFAEDDSYVRTAYSYGQVFLYRLREAMGVEDFTEMMKAYVEEFSNKVATSKDFVEFVRVYSGDNAEVDQLLEIFLPGVD